MEIEKQINSFTGDTEYSQCGKCGLIANFDLNVCPECNKPRCKRCKEEMLNGECLNCFNS